MGKNRTRGCRNHDKTKEAEMDQLYSEEGVGQRDANGLKPAEKEEKG